MCDDLVSVIMSVYNSEKHLIESIESILNQTYKNFEFIIIDDGSTDLSAKILREFSDERIKIFEQDNRGIAISLNKAISIAKGKFIARQDSDDISLIHRIEKQVEFLKDNPNISLLGTYSYLIDEKSNVIKEYTSTANNDLLKELCTKKNPFIHGSVMIRKSIFEKTGVYREQFLLSQDYDLWLRIADVSEISVIPELLYKYRLWESGVSYKKSKLKEKFDDIARDLAKERKINGRDILTGHNNYFFYLKYGKDILNNYGSKKNSTLFNFC